VQSITPADVMECLSEAAKIASQDTLKRIMTAWHRVAKTAYLSDWISRDFTFALQIPQSQIIVSHKTAYTSLETLNDVCKKLTEYGSHSGGNRYDNQIIIYALKLMYYLGLRPSETFALSREDIDMKKGELSINKELGSSTSEKWTIRPCKNNTSIRTLPIPAELQPILKELLDYSKTDNIFADHKGKYMKTWLVSSKLNRISKDLRIDFRMYQLRHQFSTDLIVGGADLRTVQELMGHADSSMTLSYARSNSSKKKSVVDDRKESKME
jgi:integrase